MPATPERAGRSPQDGSRFMSQVVANNVKLLREVQQRSQSWLAGQMRLLGEAWTQSTVSQVELGSRHVNTDELLKLAAALDASVPVLLSPRTANYLGAEEVAERIDLGASRTLPGWFVDAWIRDQMRVSLEMVDGKPQLLSMDLPEHLMEPSWPPKAPGEPGESQP
jgi:transcriptional regulator with XRE-family HTH domain